MSERGDNTPETGEGAQRERARGGYYYDDSTGYEVFHPEDDEEETADGDVDEGETA